MNITIQLGFRGRAVLTALFLSSSADSSAAPDESGHPDAIPLWSRFEVRVTNTNLYANPFKDVELNAVFKRPSGGEVRFFGFYDITK